jgi:hypothetical protein
MSEDMEEGDQERRHTNALVESESTATLDYR